MKKEKIKYISLAIVILAAGLIYSFFLSEKTISSKVILDSDELNDETQNTIENSKIYVYVCGFVVNPGVYEFDNGERVFNAIEKAGGITSEGNINNINLADLLKDGQKIQITSVEEALGEESDSLININTASQDILMTLPGIGISKAQGIISYRENIGSFNSTNDIMLVEGIKEALFSKIKDLIKV